MDKKDIQKLYDEIEPLRKTIKKAKIKMPDKVLYQAFSSDLVLKITTDMKCVSNGNILIPLSYKE